MEDDINMAKNGTMSVPVMFQDIMKAISKLDRKVDHLESKLDKLTSPCSCHRGVKGLLVENVDDGFSGSPSLALSQSEPDVSNASDREIGSVYEPRVDDITTESKQNSEFLFERGTSSLEDTLSSLDSQEILRLHSNSNDKKQDDNDDATCEQEVTIDTQIGKENDTTDMNDDDIVNSDDVKHIEDMNQVISEKDGLVDTDSKVGRAGIDKMVLEAVEDIEELLTDKDNGQSLNETHMESVNDGHHAIPTNESIDPSTEKDKDDDAHGELGHLSDTNTFNNQLSSLSSLRNDQGMTDNRFSQDTHAPELQMAFPVFTNLSNSSWIKSGAWKKDETNLKHQLRELLEQQTRSSRGSTCVRSVGIDTVICLDTSQSMEGAPLEKAKSAIIQFVQGLEQNAIDYDLEENVAVVVFGNENKILCHLTNDYSVVIDEIAQTSAGGPSPLWVGLALALTEIKERGKILTVGESHILPRIILLTDGYPTPQYVLYGNDDGEYDVEETKRDIFKFLGTCKQFTRTIDCIQVGQSIQTMLQKLTEDTGGKVYSPDDVPYLTQFFRIQDLAGDYSKRMSTGEIYFDDVQQMLKDTDLTERAQNDIMELLKSDTSVRTIEQEHKSKEKHPEKTDIVNVQNDSSNVEPVTDTSDDKIGPENKQVMNESTEPATTKVEEPVFGASVTATENCEDYQIRKDLQGTVLSPPNEGIVKVVWSDGTITKCRYGVDGQYDIRIVPALGFGLYVIRIGAIVERGPNWKWGNQDGGAGTLGVVTSLNNAIAVVVWSHGGQGNYRYGYNKKYDIKLCENRPQSKLLETNIVWQIQDAKTWHTFEPETSKIIEDKSKTQPNKEFVVTFRSLSLRISLKDLLATNLNTRQSYSIRRHQINIV